MWSKFSVSGKAWSFVHKIRVYYDRTGNTLTVWFDDPNKEFICEEIDGDGILMEDRRGQIIGFERLNYCSRKRHNEGENIPVEIEMF